MNRNDRSLYQELLAVIREADEASLVSETSKILTGHPEFTPVHAQREDMSSGRGNNFS